MDLKDKISYAIHECCREFYDDLAEQTIVELVYDICQKHHASRFDYMLEELNYWKRKANDK